MSDIGAREATHGAPGSPWAPLRNQVFRSLFVAQLASNLGTLMQSVGAAWLVGDLGGSATLIALVQTATFLPMFLMGLPAGALADLVDRRRLIVGTQAAMMVIAFTLAALSFTDRASPGGVLALTFALGLAGALAGPAWLAIQPDLVPKHQFSQSVALGAMTYNVGRAIGPALGGFVIAAAGPGWVFVINGVSFIGILLVVHRWQPPSVETTMPAETLIGATRAGLRYAAQSPLLRSVLVRVAVLTLPGAALLALLPIVVRGPLELGSGGYGVLLGCFGVGAALAAVLRPRVARWLRPDPMIVVASLVTGMVLLIQGYVDQPAIVGASLVVGGFAWSCATIVLMVSAQGALPAWVRARGLSLYMLTLTGCMAVGSALAGVLANRDLSRAHLIAAVAVVAGASTARRWPITSTTGVVDMTMIPGDEPNVVLVPSPRDGPVLVTVAYRVPEEDMASFVERMRLVEKNRRGTGAYRWGLFRDLSAPDCFLETFVVSSWAEHVRQHHRRTAVSDELFLSVRPYITGETPVGHYISPYSEAGLSHRSPDPELASIVEEP